MKLWSIMADSDSCDHYGPILVVKKPTKKELSDWCHRVDGCPEKSGPGHDGSYLYVDLERIEIKERLKDA